jgi:hypothetical protein
MKIVQIKTFIPDQEYVSADVFPYGGSVTTKSTTEKINEFLFDNEIETVCDMKHNVFQGVEEVTLIYLIEKEKISDIKELKCNNQD